MNVFQFNDGLRQELKRKSFHLLGLVYPLSLYWLGLTDFRILLIVFWVVVALMEIARLIIPAFNEFIFEYFGTLFREKERNRPTGVFWMLSGALFAALFLDTSALVVTVFLYVVFGDLTASLIGKWFGGPKWFKSEKRLSGSFACFMVCLCIGLLLLSQNYSRTIIVGGAIAATVAEMGIFVLDDNFTMPVAVTMLFWIS